MVLIKISTLGTFLVVQRLRLRLPMQGVQVQSLVRELRSHMPWATKTKDKVNNIITKFNKDLKKKNIYLGGWLRVK